MQKKVETVEQAESTVLNNNKIIMLLGLLF
jgi:hypothetical protein